MNAPSNLTTAQRFDDEIDLRELIVSIWKGKWFIASFVVTALLFAATYISFFPSKVTTILELKPISSFDIEEYSRLNSRNFHNISPELLLKLLYERLDKRDDLVDSIKNFGLIDRKKFANDSDYHEAVLKMAYNFRISPIAQQKQVNRDIVIDETIGLKITFTGYREEKILSVYDEILRNSTDYVRVSLEKRFNNKVALFEKDTQYKIEDIERKIKNLVNENKIKTDNRLLVLKEKRQLAIAGNVKNNSADARPSHPVNSEIPNSNTEYPSEYEAIEKEISLLEKRQSLAAYIPEVFELESQKMSLIENPNIERTRKAFNSSPIANKDLFKAANFSLASIDIHYAAKPVLVLALATILGLILGTFSLLVRNAIRTHLDTKS